MLLTRNEFRHKVFERDNYKCIVCSSAAIDAHHIIERRLWDDGGYYINNGVSLCSEHHIKAEQTILTVDQLRELAGITKPIIPEHLYDDEVYDKWGNIILPNGMRTKGELFNDESVQKILKEGDVLHLFTEYVKYPRTWHLPWSEGVSNDDRVIRDCSQFEGKRVIVTVKFDGENSTLYNDYLHARSIESKDHPSRHWLKNLHSKIAYDIPKGWRLCGENLFAEHTIHYKNLPSYFHLFSIWNDKNICLSWEDTIEWAELFELNVVSVLYDGIWDEKLIKKLYTTTFNSNRMEGYVVRIANEFSYGQFRKSVAKFVESSFKRDVNESCHGHWMRKMLIKNDLI